MGIGVEGYGEEKAYGGRERRRRIGIGRERRK